MPARVMSMDLKEKLATIFAASPRLANARVPKAKPVAGKWLFYVVSRSFSDQSPEDRQDLIHLILREAGGTLTPKDRRGIGLICPITPAEVRGMSRQRQAQPRG